MHTVAGPDTLNYPQFALPAPDGSLYIADTSNNRIQQLSAGGTLKVIAGTGHPGYSGDNGPATAAELNYPLGMALDAQGDLYFADAYNGALRRIDPTGVITTVTNRMYFPEGLTINASGVIYAADPGYGVIWRITSSGTISAVAEGITAGSIALLPDGSLLLAEGDLMRLTASGTSLTYYARTETATTVAYGPSGIYYTTADNLVYRAATANSEPAIFAGQLYTGDAPDNVPALGQIFGSPAATVVGGDGSIYVADPSDFKIRKIQPNGTQRVLNSGIQANALALDSAGNLYAAGGAQVWKVPPSGTATLFAGGGPSPIPPAGAVAISATSANLSAAEGVATDSAGNVYVLSMQTGYENIALITRITPAGQLTTIWDSTTYSRAAVQSPIDGYRGFAMDSQGYLVLPIGLNREILRIATDGSGIFQTLFAPDYVAAVAPASSGEIFYLTQTNRIKALNASATLFNRDVAPVETYGPEDYVTALLAVAEPDPPTPAPVLSADSQGNLYFADPSVNAIRKFQQSACFTATAPQLDVDNPFNPITPQTYVVPYITTEFGDPVYAPAELISISGVGLGPQSVTNAQASNGMVGNQLSGVQVLFQGVAGPMLSASSTGLTTAIPFGTYGYPQALMQMSYNGALSDAVAIPMFQSAPIVFTNSAGAPIVVNQDGSINSPSNPAAPGSIVTFYGSGFGLTTPAGIDGHLATVPLPQPILAVTAIVDTFPANILYAGDAAGMVEGTSQVNLRLPAKASAGMLTLVVGYNAMEFQIYVGGN